LRILIAEDDPVSRRLLEATLVRWDYEVVVACDGTEAMEILQREDAPHLALLDLVMPGMNGDQVCRLVRERARERYIYLLLLTAKSHKSDLIQGLNAGADDYLIKPVDPMELKARLNTGRRILGLQEQLIAAREENAAAGDARPASPAPGTTRPSSKSCGGSSSAPSAKAGG